MQLDVEVSPPTNSKGSSSPSKQNNASAPNLGEVNFGEVTDGQTYRQKVMHMSPLCICTGVLNKSMVSTFLGVLGQDK